MTFPKVTQILEKGHIHISMEAVHHVGTNVVFGSFFNLAETETETHAQAHTHTHTTFVAERLFLLHNDLISLLVGIFDRL